MPVTYPFIIPNSDFPITVNNVIQEKILFSNMESFNLVDWPASRADKIVFIQHFDFASLTTVAPSMLEQLMRDICLYPIRELSQEHTDMLPEGVLWKRYFKGERFLFFQISAERDMRSLTLSPNRLACFPKRKATPEPVAQPTYRTKTLNRTKTVNSITALQKTIEKISFPQHKMLLTNTGSLDEEINNQLLARKFAYL